VVELDILKRVVSLVSLAALLPVGLIKVLKVALAQRLQVRAVLVEVEVEVTKVVEVEVVLTPVLLLKPLLKV
jgi:hypothetical protein